MKEKRSGQNVCNYIVTFSSVSWFVLWISFGAMWIELHASSIFPDMSSKLLSCIVLAIKFGKFALYVAIHLSIKRIDTFSSHAKIVGEIISFVIGWAILYLVFWPIELQLK